MHPRGVAAGCAMLRLHHEQLEVIGRSQRVRDSRMTDGVLPEDRPDVPTQAIPALLVIVHNRPVTIPFSLLQRHATRLCRFVGIMDPE